MIADIRGLDVIAGDRVVLRDVRLRLAAGDRVLLSGDNGSGKTSLLRAMLPSLGGVRMLPQTHDHLPQDVTAVDYFRWAVPMYVDQAEAVLEGFLFDELDRVAVCWSWTSRPTTWTSTASMSWRRRWPSTAARCWWSPATRSSPNASG